LCQIIWAAFQDELPTNTPLAASFDNGCLIWSPSKATPASLMLTVCELVRVHYGGLEFSHSPMPIEVF
jgi:hypothetical protein